MLNGIDPIIIFNFKKLVPAAGGDIPLVAEIKNLISLPVIPLYLSEKLTGIFIDAESKTVDVATSTDGSSTGGEPKVSQKPIASTVKVSMIAKRGSIGIALFSVLVDLVFNKVASKEYSITYMHGAVTVFGGLLHSFSITQSRDNDLYEINLELINPSDVITQATPSPPTVPRFTGVRANALGG